MFRLDHIKRHILVITWESRKLFYCLFIFASQTGLACPPPFSWIITHSLYVG
ncbi:hypothetical protein HMPREF3039_00307 [Akkermansia sp. KLE1798]|nr:hypothetical protein HMPREF3039_00307 [Akkermansia sp. KLE1798]